MKFTNFTDADYQAVCDFLIALNRQKKTHINWNWARWEWMYFHPYFDRDSRHTIGLWKDEDALVGAAIYDMYYGEAFCATLEGYESLLPEVLEYAHRNLGDENGLGIAVHDDDGNMQSLLVSLGYEKAEQTEAVLCRNLEDACGYCLPEGFTIRQVRFPADYLAYQRLIWKGFDHEGDLAEWERMLAYDGPMHLHRNPLLCLSVVAPDGEFAAHCTCWYDNRTDYAYVEPVCTIPRYRGSGLGRAVVLETLRRCKALGAKTAFVISDQEFYKKTDFLPHSQYTFYWKPSACCRK